MKKKLIFQGSDYVFLLTDQTGLQQSCIRSQAEEWIQCSWFLTRWPVLVSEISFLCLYMTLFG